MNFFKFKKLLTSFVFFVGVSLSAATGYVGDINQKSDGTIWIQLVDGSGVEIGKSRLILPDVESRKSMLAMILTAKAQGDEITLIWQSGQGWVEIIY